MKIVLLVGLLACMVVAEDDETFALKFLNQYHYISPSRSGNHDVKKALENFQAFAGLPVTGELDPASIEQMKKPRCGMPDVSDTGRRIRRYKLASRWRKKHLTYFISFGSDLSQETQENVFHKALNFWADKSGLTFERTQDGPSADIKISFGSGSHGGPYDSAKVCRSPFDGPGQVLAHADFPEVGIAHFDEAERFTDGTYDGINLLWVATHEFGHSLGLDHSDVREAVMYPYYTGYQPGFNLKNDDVAGIRQHYGMPGSGGGGRPRPTPPRPTQPETKGPCVDRNPKCKFWGGSCESNEYVKGICDKTCGNC